MQLKENYFEGMPVEGKEARRILVGKGESLVLNVCPACEINDRKRGRFVERASDSSTAEKNVDITIGRWEVKITH